MTEELLTYQDAYEHLLDVFDLAGKDGDRSKRNLQRAITEAYRKLPALHDWRYFVRTTMVHTSASYNTGTIAYSSSTNQVTLTDGTWPEDAEFSHLILSEVHYKVARRVSDTVIELDTNSKPTADVASGTSYRLGRFRYLLPIDVGDIRQIIHSQIMANITRLPVEELHWRNQATNTESYPTGYAVVRSEDYPGRWELWLSSIDSTARELRVLYDARLASLPILETASGTVTVTAGEDTATFSESVLTSDHVGCVLRISTNSNKPTPRIGSWIDEDIGYVTRLPDYERVITQYTSATEAVLNREITAGASTKGYSLSTMIDVNPSSMWELFMRLAEQQYDIITRADSSKLQLSQAAVRDTLRVAMIADAQRIDPVPSPYYGVSPIINE